jgi:hypothetical protein
MEPRHLTNLWTCSSCYRDSLTLILLTRSRGDAKMWVVICSVLLSNYSFRNSASRPICACPQQTINHISEMKWPKAITCLTSPLICGVLSLKTMKSRKKQLKKPTLQIWAPNCEEVDTNSAIMLTVRLWGHAGSHITLSTAWNRIITQHT